MSEPVIVCLIGWLGLMNLLAFAAMAADKALAQKGARRISEGSLLLPAVLGGSPGAILAMYLFRHKTRHGLFQIGLPVILLAQIALAVLILK